MTKSLTPDHNKNPLSNDEFPTIHDLGIPVAIWKELGVAWNILFLIFLSY